MTFSLVLQFVARHDINFAKDLQKSWEVKSRKNDPNNNELTEEEKIHISDDIAVALGRTHPEQAAQLIRALLRIGINQRVVNALLRLKAENANLADQLFIEAVAAASLRSALPNEFVSLSAYVLPTEEDLFFGRDPLVDPKRVRVIKVFLDYVYTGSKQLSSPNNFLVGDQNKIDTELAQRTYNALRSVLNLFERLQPERAASVSEQMRVLLGFMRTEDATRAESSTQTNVR